MSAAGDQVKQRFNDVFGRAPELLVRAPGRINLIGEHVDYLEGQVLPAAIDRHVFGAGAVLKDPVLKITTTLMPPDAEPVTISIEDIVPLTDPRDTWLNYIVGVVAKYRDAGSPTPGLALAFSSDLPTGAGLSSSAALETATALLIEAASGVSQDPVDRALLCQAAEHDFAGVPCGAMDQLSVGLGQTGSATLIDCRELDFKPVRIPDGVAIVVADTQVKHALGDGEYRKRREDCERALARIGASSWRDVSIDAISTLDDPLIRRARHAVTEMQRVTDFADAMFSGDLDAIGPIMRAGHDSLRDDFEVSCAELDCLVDAAYEVDGLIGSRMTGGGFGGSTVSLVREESAEALVSHLQSVFESRFHRRIEPFITVASEGAKVLS